MRAAAPLAERLEARREEIEQAVLARVYAVDDVGAVRDPEYSVGLRGAVRAAISCGFAVLRNTSPLLEPVPQELLTQARYAAQVGVGLHTVLRRYVAGHALLDDFIVQEADAAGTEGKALEQRALRAEAALLDHLIDTVAREYNREVEIRSRSRHQRRAECVRRLLTGQLTDAGELHYEFSGWHVGVIAAGSEAESVLGDLAKEFGFQTLSVPGANGVIWAWLGNVRRPDVDRLCRQATASRGSGASFAFGEPGRDVDGWRLTHRQAMAAMPIARRDTLGVVRYGNVALLAAALQDNVLAESLRQAYLVPLEAEGDGGRALRQTLRAYMAAEWNVTSTASALGVSRQTIKRRLCAAEERLGQPLRARAAEIETALRLPLLAPASVSDCDSG